MVLQHTEGEMASYEDPDELIPCPMDPVHMVARKRMPYHIMKCQKVSSPAGMDDETPVLLGSPIL